ncbi:MAG: prealbumin-like fold domain-containing protein [Candidatus Nitrosopolaris sp.]
MRLKNTKIIISILVVVIAVVITFISVELSQNHIDRRSNIDRQLFSTHYKDASLRLITIRSDGSPLDGAIYSISPNPFGGSSNYIAKVSSLGTGESTGGIITMSGLRPGNYNVTELKAPGGYLVNGSSRIVELTSKHTATSAFVHLHLNGLNSDKSTSQIRDVIYSAKFECGSVSGNDGPLRPGHYDTDISVFNSQGYTVPFLWNAVVNNGKSTTSILKTLQPQTSASIICKDILQLFNVHNNTGNLVEGFILIRPQLDAGGLASFSGNSATVFSQPLSQDQFNLLDVQVFYSANALLTQPHDITMDKVLFSIVNDTSGKLPVSMIKKPLDITLESQVNQIIDPESQVRNALAAKYNLSSLEQAHMEIQIISVSLGASTMVDDHAISSFQVRPQSNG